MRDFVLYISSYLRERVHLRSQFEYQVAAEDLNEGRIEKAKKIGEWLIRRYYSGGYEIVGRALAAQDRYHEAISVLEEGTEKAPSVFLLWSYLGDCYSEVGRYEDALAAFHQAEHTGDNPHYARLNIAIVYGRMDELETAIQFLDGLQDQSDEHALRTRLARAWILIKWERYADVLLLCEETYERFGENADNFSYMAYALYCLGSYERAMETAWRALLLDRSRAHALEVVREVNGVVNPNSKTFRIIVEGTRMSDVGRGKHKKHGFLMAFWVKAPSPEEGLEYIRPFEPETLDPLKINEWSETDHEVDGPDGVYSASSAGYVMWEMKEKRK